MAEYIAYVPPSTAYETADSDFRLIPDEKSIFALVLPVVWLAWNRLWFYMIVYLALALASGMLAELTSNPFLGLLSILPGLYLFLEGNELLGRELQRKGWNQAGLVQAASKEEAELRFISQYHVSTQPTVYRGENRHATTVSPTPAPAIGIFPE